MLACWNALGSAKIADADVLYSISVVLIETVAGPAVSAGTPPIPFEALPDRPDRIQPTAAHPRAFQGTKYKPPKQKALPTYDLRIYLCDPKSLELLRVSLKPYWPVVDVRLKQAGYSAAQIANLIPNEKSPSANVISEYQIPAMLRSHFQPLIRHLGVPDAVTLFPAHYWALDLEENPQLLAALSKLVSLHASRETMQWLRVMVEVPAEWRLTFVYALIASGAYERSPEALLSESFTKFQQVLAGPSPVYRLYCLLRAFVIGVDAAYLLNGFRLADHPPGDYKYLRNYRFHEIRASGFFPEHAVNDLIEQQLLKSETVPYEYMNLALSVWRHCGLLNGLGAVIERIPWSRYAPDVVPAYLVMYDCCAWDELSSDKLAAKWAFIRSQVDAIENLLESISPEYHRKCIAHLKDYFWEWDEPSELSGNMPLAYSMIRRLAQAPFRIQCPASWVVSNYIGWANASDRDRFLSAPDASFMRLEEGCRLENNAKLIENGTLSFALHISLLAVDGFLDYPGKLVKVAKLLGCLGSVVRNALAKDFAQSPIMNARLLQLPLAELIDTLDRIRDSQVFDPVPRKLRDHLTGDTPPRRHSASALDGHSE